VLLISGEVLHLGLDLCWNNVCYVIFALLIQASDNQSVVFVFDADFELLAHYPLNDLSDLVFAEVAELVG
jgi:hypothetical protein